MPDFHGENFCRYFPAKRNFLEDKVGSEFMGLRESAKGKRISCWSLNSINFILFANWRIFYHNFVLHDYNLINQKTWLEKKARGLSDLSSKRRCLPLWLETLIKSWAFKKLLINQFIQLTHEFRLKAFKN